MSLAPLNDVERTVLAAVDGVLDEAVDFTRELVRIPTVNPPGESYAECAALVAGRLAALGYAVETIEAHGLPEHTTQYPRPNVVGVLAHGAGGRTLHFNGHYDVVPPGAGWSVDPFGANLRDGLIYGRGTCDQKGGIAASVYAVEAIRRAGVSLAGTVEQSATVDEESGGFAGVAYLCDRGRIRAGRQDYVVITEPLDPDRVCVGHRGVYWCDVSTVGQVGHGSMPGLALNAVDAMSRFLHALDTDLRPRLAERLTSQPVQPESARRPTVSVNALHAGQPQGQGWQSPCVPDRCTVTLDRRFIAEERLPAVRAEIVALLEALAARDSSFRYEIQDLMIVEPLVGDPEGVLARAARAAIASALGQTASTIHSPGTYDHKHILRRGAIAECVAYGPGRLPLAHQPDEHLAIVDLAASMRVMALLAMRLLGVRATA